MISLFKKFQTVANYVNQLNYLSCFVAKAIVFRTRRNFMEIP